MTKRFAEYHVLNGFDMLFPDGQIKPAFLLADISGFLGYQVRTGHLRQFGLEEGVEFVVVNANELPDTVLGGDSMRGKRTVLSDSGLYELLMLTGTNLSRSMRHWLSREVIPSVRAAGYYAIPDDHPVLAELNATIDRLSTRVAELEGRPQGTPLFRFKSLRVGDLIGLDREDD